MDGNKRMGMAAAMVFISINGHTLCAADDELVDFALMVAAGEVRDLGKIAAWLEDRSLPFDNILQAVATGTVDALAASLPGEWPVGDRPLLRILTSED